MTRTDLVGWSITAVLIAGSLLRYISSQSLLYFLHGNMDGVLWRSVRWILIGFGSLVGLIAVAGSMSTVYPGLWGPMALLFGVVWQVLKDWRPNKISWYSPIQDGLDQGERVVILGGAAGTLIAYLLTLP